MLRNELSVTPSSGEQATCGRCGASFLRLAIGLSRRRFCDVCLALKEREEHDAALVALREDFRRQSGLPFRLWKKTFASWEGESQALNLVKAWAEGFRCSAARSYKSLYLYGRENGQGKTHLAAASCNLIIDQWEGDVGQRRLSPVRYLSAPALLARVRASYRADAAETEEQVWDDLSHVPLLVVDDVLKETAAAGQDQAEASSHTQRVYFRLVDSRYGEDLPLLLVSNTKLSELERVLGRATASRIAEMTGTSIVQVLGKDRRWKEKDAEH